MLEDIKLFLATWLWPSYVAKYFPVLLANSRPHEMAKLKPKYMIIFFTEFMAKNYPAQLYDECPDVCRKLNRKWCNKNRPLISMGRQK